MSLPEITIVVVPREGFTYAEKSLASIYENTRHPFNLIYVAAGAPPAVRRFLEVQAHERHFKLISVPHFLIPNKARNLGV